MKYLYNWRLGGLARNQQRTPGASEHLGLVQKESGRDGKGHGKMVYRRLVPVEIPDNNNENELKVLRALEKDEETKENACDLPPKLCSLQCCPSWLQFNKFVLTGYRCDYTVSECLDSLLYVHNESVNIYSHGIPCVLMMILIPLTASQACLESSFWFSLHYFACFAPFFSSPIYHLFMCHKQGSTAYNGLLTFDMCGIWAVNTFGALCGIRATLFCFPIWRMTALITYILISFISLYFILGARTPKERFVPLTVFGVMRYLFIGVRLFLRYLGYGCGSDGALPYCVLMDLFACVGGVINIARVPEKWFPGQFDIIGNSHQIMHVLSVISVIFLHLGSSKEFEWMAEYKC
ncbi:predicted protein [Nematostella vectensis]|uniref:Progestin and adipoQ receptor family member 4 n=1 Tax=Nematostella vectensis TaxID=45351 RepID=A7RQG1_NEMVE|nr:predicted protein [Nematostella vectensis]|eukprot:XP_001638422.1 predicted protein [Nematostella vectensis]